MTKKIPSHEGPLWWDHRSEKGDYFQLPQTSRKTLAGNLECDVVIVGAGYTGLWSAYWLLKFNPLLSIVIVEAMSVGYGASGRNAGWLSGAFDGRPKNLAKGSSVQAVIALRKAFEAGVDEVLEVLRNEGIDADAVKDGCIRLATNAAQARRLRDSIETERAWGSTEDDLRMLTMNELNQRIVISGAVAGAFTPHVARVHPAKLVHGLAATVERLGATIFENSPVINIEPHFVTTAMGRVQGKFVIRATEGYTAKLPHLARRLLPMNSSMISTEPLAKSVWDQIGWFGAETLSDEAHSYVYLQRSGDDRILLGGRGIPYLYGNRFDLAGRVPNPTTTSLIKMLHQLFPATIDAEITHSWSGVLGVSRDFSPGVSFDAKSGTAWAGGYTGQGVTAAYMAGRTLADLITGQNTLRTHFPWVGHFNRLWEPEPLRWLGVRGMYFAYRTADRIEERRGNDRTSWLAHVANKISGR
jgi:glycine/D-amino acid oxidase-like deaminating enzyme